MANPGRIISGNFSFTPTAIAGLTIVDTVTHGDARGSTMETYVQGDFARGGISSAFIQDNQSVSSQGVLRGLHFQVSHPQAKLIRVAYGEIFDVAVDLREGSPTYGRWEGVLLSGENGRQLYIPRHFAHGFLVLSPTALCCYKCDDTYHPQDEGGIRWDDPTLDINWPLKEGVPPLLSAKDRALPLLKGD